MRRFVLALSFLALAALAAVLAAPAPSRAAEPVDVELIIAVDVSRSVDVEEGRLQRAGYVAAFSDEVVVEAIQSGFFGKIAILYFEWGSMDWQKVVLDWTVVEDAASAKAYAARLNAAPISSNQRTAISAAIDWAVPRFDQNAYDGKRRVIDVSGDGPNNFSRPVTDARDAAVARGITINGLPIINRSPSGYGGLGGLARAEDLAPYFENCVIGGRGAFMVVANGFQDFANAIRQKLVMEIAGLTPPGAPADASEKAAQAPLPAPRGTTRPAGDGGLLVPAQSPVSCENRFGGYFDGSGGSDGFRYLP